MCNAPDENKIWVAYSYVENKTWVTKGWRTIDKGKCVILVVIRLRTGICTTTPKA